MPSDQTDLVIEQFHGTANPEIGGLAGLIEAVTAFDAHRPVGEHALVELKQGPKVFPHAAFVARAGESIVGYAHLSARETNTGWRLEAFTLPGRRGEGIATRLLDHALDHVADHGGGHIHAWAYRPGDAQARLAERYGMTRIRALYRMVVPLPLAEEPLPYGVGVRAFTPDDADAWIALHNEVFATHPDAGNWRPADLAWHLEEPWFRADGFLLAEDDEGLCGYCWVKLDERDAWIYFLGVAERMRGTGLARALCVAGLAWGAREGAQRGVLYVDEGNTRAVRLYQGLGFEVDHTDHCYALEVPPRV